MIIDINKKYVSLSGYEVKFIHVHDFGTFKYVGYLVGNLDFVIYQWDKNGYNSIAPILNLIEVNSYADFKKDDPVMVRNYPNEIWLRRYFSHVNKLGKAECFDDGKTSWTNIDGFTAIWLECRKPTAEELKE